MSEYYSVTTKVGDAAIANAITNNKKLNITHVAFGDGNGSVPTPDKNRTALVREVHRQAVNKYTQHETVANWITVEVIIPSNIGGFYIREVGIIADGVLISDGSVPPTFKEATNDGVREYRLRLTIDIQSADVVSLILDESLIYASQKWVEENYIRRNEIVDNVITDDAKKPLSAKQGKLLQDTKFKAVGAVSSLTTYPTWNSKSGVYVKDNGDSSSTVLHFLSTGSCPAIQFNVAYANGGLFYRSARDSFGFESEFEKIVTEKSGVATSALKLENARTVSFSGSATGSFTYDGSGNSSGILTLANSGVVAGTYGTALKIPTLTVNSQGLITGVTEKDLPIVNNLTAGGITSLLSAEQGKLLNTQKLGVSDNAVSATKLQTARTINNVSFDGTQNINVNASFSEFIPDNADLNNYKTPGLYFCPTNIVAETQSNLPYSSAYSLFIELSAGSKQTFTSYDSNRTWIRRFCDNSWSAWRELAFLDPSDQTFTQNIDVTRAGGAQIQLTSTTDNTTQVVLDNTKRTVTMGVQGSSSYFSFWDATNAKTLFGCTKDGNNFDINQYVNINTPLESNNATGTASFSVTGGESSPIKFKINQSGSIKTNASSSVEAINHALSFNWYATEWQIGNVRGGSKDSIGFGLTKGNDTLVWRHDGGTQYNYGNIISTGAFTTSGDITTGGSLITNTGRIASPNTNYHYIDIGKDGTDLTTFAQYGGSFRFLNSSGNADVMTLNTGVANFVNAQILTKPPVFKETLTDLGDSSGGTSPIFIPHISTPLNKTGYIPFIRGSVETNGYGYVTQVSIGAYRGSNTWSNSGAYIAIGGNDVKPTEAFYFITGGGVNHSSGAIFTNNVLTTTSNMNVGNNLVVTGTTTLNNGAIITNGLLKTNATQMQILATNGSAKGIAAGGVLSSDGYADWNKVPANGIYSKGDIKTATWMYASRYVGSAGGDATFQGALTGNAGSATKLQTARTVSFSGAATGSFNFDGSQNITCSLSNPDLDILPYLPQPYPKAIPPSGYLSLAGQTITQSQYPNLYALYGATLPDMRGEFIRGFDNGRGVDLGRSILSWQDDDLRSHTHSYFQVSGGGGGQTSGGGSSYNRGVSTSNTGGTETRPRNISFNYIVKAG